MVAKMKVKQTVFMNCGRLYKDKLRLSL